MVERCATCGVRWQKDVSLIRAHQLSLGLPQIPLCRPCATGIGYCATPCDWPGGCTTLAEGGVHAHRCHFHSLQKCEVDDCESATRLQRLACTVIAAISIRFGSARSTIATRLQSLACTVIAAIFICCMCQQSYYSTTHSRECRILCCHWSRFD